MNQKILFSRHISEFDGYSCKFSPFEANKIACGFSQYYGIIGNGRLSIFNINPISSNFLEEIQRFNTNDGIFDIAWSESNENQLITGCGDGSVKLWDLSHKLPLLNFKEHNSEVFGVAWNHTLTNLIADCGLDSTCKIYDLSKNICLNTFIGHKSVVYSVTWHPTMNNVFASASKDRTVKLWDTKSGKIMKTIVAQNAEVMSCDFNKYENIIATGGSDGSINLFDLRGTGDVPLMAINGHFLTTRKVQFSPFFSEILASVGYDMNVILWDIKKNAPLMVHKHHREFVVGVDFSLFDNKKIATTSWDKSLYVFNWDEQFQL